MTRIAVDLEEVLADTIQEACRSTQKLEPADFDEWDISDYTWQVYAGVSDALWRHDPTAIPKVERGVADTMDKLCLRAETVDIVTARLHVDDSIDTWLRVNNIPHDEIVSTDRPKYELDYDVYIDDNPEMHGRCRLLLRDHAHNRHIDARSSKTTDRIYTLDEAVDFV